MTLEGRVALVTGGGRGIGRAVSLALAAAGADVAVNYRRDAEAAAEAVAAIEGLGRRARAYQASVDDFDQDRAMADAATADLGPVDILVNNGGVASRGRSVADTDPAEVHRLLAVHAAGAHHLCALVLPGMRERPRGDIVMISSTAARTLDARGAPYNMGKAALEALAATLAKEEAANGVRVNIVAPGLVATEMGDRLMKATVGVERATDLDRTMPFGRVVRPEDVAAVVCWLVSQEAELVTGQRIEVSGDATDR